jgi:hypothetical protein
MAGSSNSGKGFESTSDDSKSKGAGIQSGEQNAFFESNVICFGKYRLNDLILFDLLL